MWHVVLYFLVFVKGELQARRGFMLICHAMYAGLWQSLYLDPLAVLKSNNCQYLMFKHLIQVLLLYATTSIFLYSCIYNNLLYSYYVMARSLKVPLQFIFRTYRKVILTHVYVNNCFGHAKWHWCYASVMNVSKNSTSHCYEESYAEVWQTVAIYIVSLAYPSLM